MACEKIASGTLVMALCSRHRDWGGGTGGGREEEGGEEGGRRGGREDLCIKMIKDSSFVNRL